MADLSNIFVLVHLRMRRYQPFKPTTSMRSRRRLEGVNQNKTADSVQKSEIKVAAPTPTRGS